MRIYLIGYSASGKSFVGKQLATLIKFDFVDMDAAIEMEQGMSIAEVFAARGEKGFRSVEQAFLFTTSTLENTVIATGGGTPAHDDNMKWMKQHGITVFLNTGLGHLYQRLVADRAQRPRLMKLNDIELMEQIVEDLTIRKKFYKQAEITLSNELIAAPAIEAAIKKKKLL